MRFAHDCAKDLHFYCSHKMNKFLIENIWLVKYTRNYAISWVSFPISISSCQAAVKKVMSTYPGLNLVPSIFSCLAALTYPDVYLSWTKFSSSLVDIKICHNRWKSEEIFYKSHITITIYMLGNFSCLCSRLRIFVSKFTFQNFF